MENVWRKAGRWVAIGVVLCFFLPFFGISCQGQELVTISGADMVGGCKPGGMLADSAGGMGGGMGGGNATMKVGNVEREPLAIAAFACVLMVAGLAWVRKKPAVVAACLLGVAGVGSMAGMYVKVGGDLKDQADKGAMTQQPQTADMDMDLPSMGSGDAPDLSGAMQGAASEMGNKMAKEMNIDAGPRAGFWITSIGFLFIAAFAGLGIRDKTLPA